MEIWCNCPRAETKEATKRDILSSDCEGFTEIIQNVSINSPALAADCHFITSSHILYMTKKKEEQYYEPDQNV